MAVTDFPVPTFLSLNRALVTATTTLSVEIVPEAVPVALAVAVPSYGLSVAVMLAVAGFCVMSAFVVGMAEARR